MAYSEAIGEKPADESISKRRTSLHSVNQDTFIPVSTGKNSSNMEDKGPTILQLVWMIIAILGLAGIILGNRHHILTLVLGTAMLMISKKENDNNY